MSNDIVVVGSCMIDFVSYTVNLPKAGETVHGNKFVTGFGGKGANQCVAAAKLGGKTTFVARVGEDSWGHDYVKKLNSEKVDTAFTQITPGETTGIAQIAVDKAGENQIVIIPGANLKLSQDDVNKAKDRIAKAKVLVMQLEIPRETAQEAMKLCKGISILNGAPAVDDADCCFLKAPTIFCINETEASVFSGLPVKNVNDAKAAIAELLNRGCQSVLLTLGPDGALYASQKSKQPVHISSPKVTAVDSTGAGDSFIGALAYMLANKSELPIEKSIEVSCRLAAISVTKQGTHPSYPDAQELQKLLREMNL